jgi:hypothetical protein
MTQATKEALATLAGEWVDRGTDAMGASRELAQTGAPISLCLAANEIASKCLELAERLNDLAKNAAPMPGRED